jgi:hypothetical protein
MTPRPVLRSPRVPRTTPVALAVAAALLGAWRSAVAQAPPRRYPLASPDGLRLHHVRAEAVRHAGRRGLRVTAADATADETLAVVEGSDFSDGVIEAEIAGAPGPGASPTARGFVGLAFRVGPDLRTYDAFYLRPTNGRAAEQERRNHAAQYISHPDWTWERLRRETPGRYEAYVDLVPGAWTRVRVEVRGDTARLFVHGAPEPTLVVGDVKTGARGRGAVALWIGGGTVAHFRDLRVRPTAPSPARP